MADDNGHQDPYLDPLKESINPTMQPATIIQLAYLGCALTREQYRHAWASTTDKGIRAMLHAYGHAHHAGWAS